MAAAPAQIGVVNFAPEKFSVELREIPRPAIGPDDVLLEVAAVGVCGSDLHQWTAEHSWPVNYPVVLGHEFTGVVVELGQNVRGFREGDRAVSETAAVVDPNNPLTKAGLYNLDPTRKGFGYGVNGAMTNYVRVPSRILHSIPDHLSFERASLTEPCCVAYNAVVGNGSIKPGDRIAVLGPGPIGVLCGAMAKLQGAEVAVVGIERDRQRLKIAAAFGCQTIVEGIQDWAKAADGLGVDGVIDAAGISATLQTAIDIARPGGWISKVGWGRAPFNHSLDPLVQKNLTLRGSFSHNWPIWERVIRLLSTGALDVSKIIGGTWTFDQWQTAFEEMHSGRICKAVLKPR
ncbi:MAG TPA: zinc-binding dehydrogenase [Pirellulales bacterium]|jgi:alcohol dehydrogenase/L-iditol 2-dehydrogenase|nr:zinc-binding dehydrogenase [Pirellulales bacterium]